MSRSDRDETIQGWVDQLWPERRWEFFDGERIELSFRRLGLEPEFPSPGMFLAEFTGTYRLEPESADRPWERLDERRSIHYRKPLDVPFVGRIAITIWWHPDMPEREALPSQAQREEWERECAALPDAFTKMKLCPGAGRKGKKQDF